VGDRVVLGRSGTYQIDEMMLDPGWAPSPKCDTTAFLFHQAALPEHSGRGRFWGAKKATGWDLLKPHDRGHRPILLIV